MIYENSPNWVSYDVLLQVMTDRRHRRDTQAERDYALDLTHELSFLAREAKAQEARNAGHKDSQGKRGS